MNWFDATNAAFEIGGSVFTWVNVRALFRDKMVRGVRIEATVLFTIWGAWNCVWYPHLGQWLSFFGGLFIFFANIAWIVLALKYRRN